MKSTIITLALVCVSTLVQAQSVKDFVNNHMESYPQLRLLDIYKSCFQDFMGPEHLVADTASVSAYLDQELEGMAGETPADGYYEPCGPEGKHVRVNLSAVQEGVITKQTLLNAFVRSANGKHPSVKAWKKRWRKMLRTIDGMHLDLPHYAEDRAFIDGVLNQGKYAISHSPEFREAYHPHYRIVERSIFERELKPLLDQANKNF